MSSARVLVIGAGAAGSAAARVLTAASAASVTLIGRTGETPYNRTLVNKGIASGLLTPDQAALPGTGALLDTAIDIDVVGQRVHLASGQSVGYEALLVATGSIPRGLESTIPGAERAAVAGRLSTLHSVEDAMRVREALAAIDGPGRIVISGAGLVAGETATLLRAAGHHVTLIARSSLPGVHVFGQSIARLIAEAHSSYFSTEFGRVPVGFQVDAKGLNVRLDDGTTLRADLFVVAHGTIPMAPAPWTSGVGVDESLRAANSGVYAAGGAAIHHDDVLGTWRIDHWAEAAAQGEHAARAILSDLGAAADPGRYRPRALFTSEISGRVIAGAGITATDMPTRMESADPPVIVSEHQGVPIGVIGIDAISAVFNWIPRLHAVAGSPGEAMQRPESITSPAADAISV